MKSNIDTGLDDQEKVQQPPTPTHSLASSSCGSYSVTPSIHNTPYGTVSQKLFLKFLIFDEHQGLLT